MAAVFTWKEDGGVITSSHGTTRTDSRAERDYKNIDDTTTAYTASPIVAGNNSFSKYQYGHFASGFNTILNGKWSAHTAPAGALATGLTLVGKVTSTYVQPATTALGGSPTDFTTAVAIGSGTAVSFSTSGPEDSGPTSTLAAAGYSQYLVTQLQTSSSAAAGNMAQITETFQYDEN